MGRQIRFHVLPEDAQLLWKYVSETDDVVAVSWSSQSEEIVPIADPSNARVPLALWNRDLLPNIHREWARRDGGRDEYRVPYSLPVLELSPSNRTLWKGHEALLEGRVYGFSFDGRSTEYAAWFNRVARWIRKHFLRSPVSLLDDYVGPSAMSWFSRGGVFLPAFVPPTDSVEWIQFLEDQLRSREMRMDEPGRQKRRSRSHR